MSKEIKVGLAIGGVTIAAALAAFVFSRNMGSFSSASGKKNPAVATEKTSQEVIGTINGKTVSKSDLTNAEMLKLFDAETQMYGAYEDLLIKRYLNGFFEKYQKEKNLSSVNEAREQYVKSKINVPEDQVKQITEQYKNSEQLRNLSPEQQLKEVRNALEGQYKQGIIQSLVADARKNGELAMLMAKPVEPRIEIGDGNNPYLGPKNAPVTIIEFADYQCPFCARMLPALQEVMKKYDGKVRWVYRDFPLDFHPNALPAAIVADCVYSLTNSREKYFEAHNILFENYAKLGEDVYAKVVDNFKLDKAKFETCRKDPAIKAEIMADYEAGQEIGVNGTPSYFINGKRLSAGRSAEDFSKAIDEELALAKK